MLSSIKPVFIVVPILVLLGVGLFVGLYNKSQKTQIEFVEDSKAERSKILGRSVQGLDISAYTYGDGDTHLLFVGGIHGGYEWNSVMLAYEFMDYLNENREFLPDNLTVTVIPVLNPDGLYKVIGKTGRFAMTDVSLNKETLASGRFNAREVDLNRNFDCKWKPTSTWQTRVVSAGESPFSEPEALALRDFVLENRPEAVVFWHSQANTVYASECEKGILPETKSLMEIYSKAAGYFAVESFDAYEITGDAEGWLASIGIPAITVELKTRESIEWTQNLSGIKSIFEYYGSKTKI